MARTKQERFDALQRSLCRAWGRVHRLDVKLQEARREVQRLLERKVELMHEED